MNQCWLLQTLIFVHRNVGYLNIAVAIDPSQSKGMANLAACFQTGLFSDQEQNDVVFNMAMNHTGEV